MREIILSLDSLQRLEKYAKEKQMRNFFHSAEKIDSNSFLVRVDEEVFYGLQSVDEDPNAAIAKLTGGLQ